MKKILLFSLALSFSFAAMADGKSGVKKAAKANNSKDKIEAIVNPTQVTSMVTPELNFKGTQSVERIYMGKSANVYSVLLEEQRSLDYNDELNAYSFTFRTDPDTYTEAAGSGSLITVTSDDGGNNWSDTWLLNTGDAARYPSGVIYNPEGNTDFSEAYAIAVGPVTESNEWTKNVFASSKINGNDLDNQFFDVDPDYSGSQLVRNGLTVCSDGLAHIVASKWQDNGSGVATELGMSVWNGEFNGSSFDWEELEVEVDLALRADGTVKQLWSFGTAWSNDGSIGYMWLKGVTSDIENGYQPIVFMTTDQGENWDEIEIILEDNEALSEYLWATNNFNGPVWPFVSELDAVVDQNGKLQMFINTTSSSSTHPDSSSYVYSSALNYVYNLEIDEDGVQQVLFVDSIMASDVPADNEYGLGGVVGWGARLRASKTADGSAVFAVWTDSEDPESTGGYNANPNIKAAGRLIGGDFTDFPVTNFTSDDLFAGFYYFINVGQVSSIADNFVHIPISTSVTPGEFGSGLELTPTTHNFVKGVKFPWTVGLNKLERASNISVSQNQPNPFNGITSIEITSNSIAAVSVEITNLTGQIVFSMDAGIITGSKKVNLNANDLKSGVYFYTVRIGAESVTKKMIIE